MPITTTIEFDAEKEKQGHFPVFLVELLGLGRFFATKEPGFSGLWLADQGLTATTSDDTSFEILAGDSQPTYTEGIHKLSNNGIGTISFALAPDDFARTGDSAVSFLNEAFLNLALEDEILENTVVRIMLGFDGLPRSSYIPIFKGVVDSSAAAFERFDMRLADDTIRNIVPVPAQIGNDFLPRAFDQGSAFPIVVGCAEDVPMVQLVGDASTFLGVGLTTSDTELFYFNPTIPFPNAGTVRVTNSAVNYTVDYDGVSTRAINGQVFGVLSLTETPASTTATGASVTLEDQLKKYVVSFAGQNIRRIRKDTGAAPADAPVFGNEAIDPTGGDPRRITVVSLPNSTADGESMIATIASEARGPNLFVNGNFHNTAVGWTTVAGAFDRFLPASTFDQVGRIRTLAAQVFQTNVNQDITVVPDRRFRFTFTARNVDLDFMAVNIGTPTDATKYFQFGDIDGTPEQLFDLTFAPDEAIVRITLIGDNGGSGSAQEGYFDQFDMYDLNTENPSPQIEALIRTHMPQIEPDTDSFAEALDDWAATGDRISGVLQQTEEQQALLGRIAQQFRAKTFLNEDGKQKIRVFDHNRVPERRLTATDIVKGSMKVRRSPLSEIHTSYFVYYGRIPDLPSAGDLGGRQAFSGVAVATPSETSHPSVSLNTFCSDARDQFRKESTLDVFADLIPDSQTAQNLLEFLVRRGTHQRLRCEFESYLRVVGIEVTDFIEIQHPLLGATAKFEVKEKEIAPNGCTTRWVVEEVIVERFGSFTEKWDLVPVRLKAEILTEPWEPGAPGEAAPPSEDNPFNPFIETWEEHVTDHELSFQTWDTGETLEDSLFGAANDTTGNFTFNGYEDSASRKGITMWPNIVFASLKRPLTVLANPVFTALRSKVYSIGQALALSISKDEFETRSSSYELRPSFGASKGEFIRIHSLPEMTFPQNNSAIAETYDFDAFHAGSLVNMERPFSLRIFVKLNNKSTDHPIWQGYDQQATDADPITRIPYAIYYNSSTDRFEFAVANNIPGVGSTIGTNVASLSQKVQASTFGSPATATWYQIVATYDPATTTATIKVNAGTQDSNVITPDFTTGLIHPGLIGGWSLTDDGTKLTADHPQGDGLGIARVTLNGHVAHWAYWGRLITTAEATTLYNAGTPHRFDDFS